MISAAQADYVKGDRGRNLNDVFSNSKKYVK